MKQVFLQAAVVLAIAGCDAGQEAVTVEGEKTGDNSSGLTWEQFVSTKVYQEPGTGVYIADGDTPFFSQKLLREFYEKNVRNGQLIVNRVGNADDRWSDTQKLNISYCVSNSFGSRKTAMLQAMVDATGAWEAVANVKYVHVAAEDANCTASNNNVVFDVNPVNVNGAYLARAFFPSEIRAERNVLVDDSSFTTPGIPLVGVLRHELGHTLGFRHEHTRPESGTCFEDNNWRALTTYDSASVMHYPQCNGTGSFDSLVLTARDAQGAAALYGSSSGTGGGGGGAGGGSAGGGAGGGSAGGGAGAGGGSGSVTVETFSASIARGASKSYGPFAVQPGTSFKASITGTGDADLYVRFGAAPTTSTYACRPYRDGSNETCTLTVPSTQTSAYITVNGYAAASYTLRVEYTKSPGSPEPTGTPHTVGSSGSVSRNQLWQFDPFTVLPGSKFTAKMTGTGDPDLYIRFGAAPSLTAFDCRPYVNGATETCDLVVPTGATKAYMAIHGYTAGTYNVVVDYVSP